VLQLEKLKECLRASFIYQAINQSWRDVFIKISHIKRAISPFKINFFRSLKKHPSLTAQWRFGWVLRLKILQASQICKTIEEKLSFNIFLLIIQNLMSHSKGQIQLKEEVFSFQSVTKIILWLNYFNHLTSWQKELPL